MNNQTMDLILNNPQVRKALAMKSHEFFFGTYFPHFITYPSADIHKKLFNITQEEKLKLAIAMVFRGSGKSTICTTSYPIWSVLGTQQKKFVLIVSKNIQQSERHLENIRYECEDNERLRKDFGQVFEEATPWNTKALSFPKYGAQIATISIEQSMRGIRHGAHRPDLIILDDLEDLASVKTKESRDKLFDWLAHDLIPAGTEHTKIILIGNNLHRDSLLNRLIDRYKKNQLDATVIKQAIVNDDGTITWPGRFPTHTSLEEFKRTIPSERAWLQEYMLQNIAPEDQIIKDNQIHYYNETPNLRVQKFYAIGIDLAISLAPTADKTAMVQAEVQGTGEDLKIYILPGMVNNKLTGSQGLQKAEQLSNNLAKKGKTYTFVETVAYQKIFTEELRSKGIRNVIEYTPGNQSKEDRLWSISGAIESGQILFPKSGAETLIDQLLGFNVERYDDLADALTTLAINVLKLNRPKNTINMSVGDFSHILTIEEMEIEKENINHNIKTAYDISHYQDARIKQWEKEGIPYHAIPPFYR